MREENFGEEIGIWKVTLADESLMVVFDKLKTENMFLTNHT
jgi:hypothetical protein